jgi:hypothetical protein
MLPGDSFEKYYCVSVTHDAPQTVCFGIDADPTQKLLGVMRVKVQQLLPNEADKVLYDGLMKDCHSVCVNIETNPENISEIYYRVTVYTLGEDVGNEYVGEDMTADFIWQIR